MNPKSRRSVSKVSFSVWAVWLVALAGCSSDPNLLKTRVWPVTSPETQKVPLCPEWEGRQRPERTVGLAFAGGGTLSASVTVGALRGLRHLGLLQKVDYISAVSGGAWGALPWVFLDVEAARRAGVLSQQGTAEDLDDLYLGRYTPPSKLTLADFQPTPRGSLTQMVTDTAFGIPFFDMRGDENYANQLAKTFLKPVGLDDQSRWAMWNAQQRDAFIARNPGRKLGPDQFYLSGAGKPFMIANMALERPERTNIFNKAAALLVPGLPTGLVKGYHHAESTPLYTGMRVTSKHGWWPEPDAGGGFIENPGFDAHFQKWGTSGKEAVVKPMKSKIWPRQQSAYSLADMLAATGSAPAAAWGWLFDGLGFRPEFDSFHVSSANPQATNREHPYVDGGACENTGVAALLARGVTDIVVFLNATDAFDYRYASEPSHLPTMVTSLFGKPGSEKWRNALGNPETNHLLENKGGKLEKLSEAFGKLAREGKPLVVCDDYVTSQDKKSLRRYGVRAGQPVRICWVYQTSISLLPKTSAEDYAATLARNFWLSQLSEPVRQLFSQKNLKKNHLANFPVFSVFFTNSGKVQDLKATQANGLAHYSSENVVSSAATIRRCFPR